MEADLKKKNHLRFGKKAIEKLIKPVETTLEGGLPRATCFTGTSYTQSWMQLRVRVVIGYACSPAPALISFC